MNDVYSASLKANEDAIVATVKRLGISLEEGKCFDDFSQIIAKQPERHKIAPIFKPDCDLANVEDQWWLAGYDKFGELVHTQAIKLFDIEQMSFDAFLRWQIWNIFPGGYSPDYQVRKFYLSNKAQKISGRITYHGELWLKDTYRGGCLAILLTRLMLIRSLMRWSPDYFMGFQRPLSALRGLGARESYVRLEQRTLILYNQKLADFFEVWLAWMSREEAAFNLRLPVQMLEALFEPG